MIFTGFFGLHMRLVLELLQALWNSTTDIVFHILVILPAIYIVNWIIYAIVVEVIWVAEDPPEFLQILSVFLDIIYDPLPLRAREDQEPDVPFWLSPFSHWLSAVVLFMIWVLPDHVIKVYPEAAQGELPESEYF